jgi:hypothetical protein
MRRSYIAIATRFIYLASVLDFDGLTAPTQEVAALKVKLSH